MASLALLALGPATGRGGVATAADATGLQQQIAAGEDAISGLAEAIGAATARLHALNTNMAALQARISAIQTDLDAKRARLLALRGQLAAARTRLAQLQQLQARAEAVLATQVVGTYEGERPDIVTVVLEAHGFQDLLEQITFAQRIQKQDARVVIEVRAARRAVAAQAVRLGALEERQQALTQAVLSQRDSLAQTQMTLMREQLAVAQARSQKTGRLADLRAHVSDLEGRLNKLEATQAPATGASVGAGGFVFPLPKGSAAGAGSWTPDDGVDIAAPGGTPEYAVCSGTVVLHGIGGFGPWAPVLHCDTPVGGYSYVYYGHAGPGHQLPVGTHVSAGEVMSEVGSGIVGISTGPHIEIGFSDSSGTPVGPASAGAMMSLLQGAYGA